MTKGSLFMTLLMLISTSVSAQDTITFTTGLAVSSGSRYGREAVYTDRLAWSLYTGAMNKPEADALFAKQENGTTINWVEAHADYTGRFRLFNRALAQTGTNPFLNPGSADRGSDYLYLTYNSPVLRTAIVHIQGNSGVIVNGEPHMGDPYSSGYMFIPVMLKRGVNELYIRGANIWPRIILPKKEVQLSTADLTLPHIVLGQANDRLMAALVVINTSTSELKGYRVTTVCEGRSRTVTIPAIPAMATRKVILEADAAAVDKEGKYPCTVSLLSPAGKRVDEQIITLEAVPATKQYSQTFISEIDGSLQYYAVTPQANGPVKNAALFLSVHGAGVEAIGQARAYKPKDWGTLAAPTNRRPRGFNWEDWGRIDALEVLELAKERLQPDPQRIYLTGHSMGGHGTWFLGVTYPEKWAAIAPCAGYASLKDYGSADGRIPAGSTIPAEQILLRAGNQSDVQKLATNYKPLGIYIFHGDSDRVVPVTYARQMKDLLTSLRQQFSYYEYPGGEHWFGDQSVDWDPLFNYFKEHTIAPDSLVNQVDFSTASPGISSTYRWATIWQQPQPLDFSRLQLQRDLQLKKITGHTSNVSLLRLALHDFGNHATIAIHLDNAETIQYTTVTANDTLFLSRSANGWQKAAAPPVSEKGPHRYGTFKEAFNHRMLFVVGTGGKKKERDAFWAKANYDLESWYYRGNGAIDIITDKEYLLGGYDNRNVILYGNADNNKAWNSLLADCPVQVKDNEITAGIHNWKGNNLAAYFVWPQKNPRLLTGVVTATGVTGIKASYANQYFAGGSGFPDYMIFDAGIMKEGAQSVKLAGFFDHQWKMKE